MALGLILVPLAAKGGVGLFMLSLTLVAVGNGINNPSLMSLVSKTASRHELGSAMGIYQSAGSMARIIGPLSAGWLYDNLGHGSPFEVAGVVMAGAVFVGMNIFSVSLRTQKNAA